MIEVGAGDLAAARRELEEAARDVPSAQIAVYAARYREMGWMLDSAMQRLVLEAAPEALDGDRAKLQYAWCGDSAPARQWADTARVHFARQLRESPDDAQAHALHGLALAFLGRRAEARAAGRRGVAMVPTSSDAQ